MNNNSVNRTPIPNKNYSNKNKQEDETSNKNTTKSEQIINIAIKPTLWLNRN